MTGQLPSGHITFIQRCLNVDATSWRCIDVEATLYRRHVSAGFRPILNMYRDLWQRRLLPHSEHVYGSVINISDSILNTYSDSEKKSLTPCLICIQTCDKTPLTSVLIYIQICYKTSPFLICIQICFKDVFHPIFNMYRNLWLTSLTPF